MYYDPLVSMYDLWITQALRCKWVVCFCSMKQMALKMSPIVTPFIYV